MKTIAEILENKRLNIEVVEDGVVGYIAMPTWKGTVICTTGAGWEHVSVSPMAKRIIPTWNDMCMIKDMFFNEDEAVIQVHPPKADYVNFMENCLHLWRCTYKEMVLPPSILVGPRAGMTAADIKREIKGAYEMAGETYCE